MTEVLTVAELQALRRKPSKYRNVKVRSDGYAFDSKAEYRRYEELVLLERAGEITQLGVHPRYALEVLGEKICVYEADFSYQDRVGALHVEDVKGVRTREFILKKNLMRAIHGIEVIEIT